MKQLLTNLKKEKSYIFIFLLTSLFIPLPAHAYAGPGVAIGALLVFITVVITFFASFLLSIFNYIKKLTRLTVRLIQKIKRRKSNKRRNHKH